MTPPRKYESALEEYIDRQQGMWYWIAIDPLNRNREAYCEKFIPNYHLRETNLACHYADSNCQNCFLDSNREKCSEIMCRFYKAAEEGNETLARAIAIEIAEIPVRKDVHI